MHTTGAVTANFSRFAVKHICCQFCSSVLSTAHTWITFKPFPITVNLRDQFEHERSLCRNNFNLVQNCNLLTLCKELDSKVIITPILPSCLTNIRQGCVSKSIVSLSQWFSTRGVHAASYESKCRPPCWTWVKITFSFTIHFSFYINSNMY